MADQNGNQSTPAAPERKKYFVLHSIEVSGKKYDRGATVTLTEKEAVRPLKARYIKVA